MDLIIQPPNSKDEISLTAKSEVVDGRIGDKKFKFIRFYYMGAFKDYIKEHIAIFISLGLILVGLLLLLILILPLTHPFGSILNSIGQTFLSVGILLLIFQFPLIREDLTDFLAEAIKRKEFLKHLNKESLRELIVTSLEFYFKISYSRLFSFYLKSLEDAIPYFYKELNQKFFLEFRNGFLIRKVHSNYRIYTTRKVKLFELINKPILLEHNEDEYIINKLVFKMNKNSYTVSKEILENLELNSISEDSKVHKDLKEEYTKKVVNLNQKLFEKFCLKNNIPLEIDANTEVIINREDIRKIKNTDNKIILKTRHFIEKCNISVQVINKELKPYLVSFHSNEEDINIVKEANTITVESAKWLHAGSGFIIIIDQVNG